MKKNNFKTACVTLSAAAILFFSVNANAQVKSKIKINKVSDQIIPFDKAVRTGKLANGFTYYIRHNEEPQKRVVMYLANKVGSVLETDEQQGLAHFMEHMNFNGTKNFPHNELVNYLQKIGVRFGADINAYTSFDETVYQLPLPSDKPEIVENGLKIMRDWAHGATLDPMEIDKERGVVLEEKRLGKGPQERMATKYYPMLFNNSRYANRLPIGTEAVLKNFKPETIRAYYEDWYRPNLQALIIVGDINVDEIEKKIKAKFANLKNPASPKPRTHYTIPLTDKNQFLVVTDKEATSTQAQIFIKQKGIPLKTVAQFKVSIIEQLFYRMLRERIVELSQVGKPPFLGASISIGEFLADLNNFTVSVSANPGDLEGGFKSIWREVQRLKKYGITTTELDRAKADQLKTLNAGLVEKNKTASESYVKEYLQHFLKGTASPGIDYEYALSQRIINAITVADVNKLVNESIKEINRDILITAPEKDKLPNEKTFLSWMNAVENENIAPYQDKTSSLALLKIQPKPGKIVNSERDSKLNITTLTLSNGVKVILKKTDYKNDDIFINAVSFGGHSWYPDSIFRTAAAANNISNYGAGNYSSAQLRKYLSGKQAFVTTVIDEKTQRIKAYTKNNDLKTALELVHAYITEPRLDIEQFNGSIASKIAAMVNDSDNPNAVFLDTILSAQNGGNVRRRRETVEELKKENGVKAFEIYKERWADASGLSFMFVGSIDTLTIKPLLEKYLGSLPSTYTNKGFKDLNYYPLRGSKERTVYMGKEPKATVQLFFTGLYDFSYRENLILEAMNQTLSIKVTERLREAEGGVYSPQVQAGGTKASGGWYNIIVQFGCAPENVEKLIASTNDEIGKLLKNGPSETDLAKFKIEEKRQFEVKQQNNGFWAGYLESQILSNSDLHEIFKYDSVIDAITVDDVKKIANKYFNYKNYSKFVLMPDKKVENN